MERDEYLIEGALPLLRNEQLRIVDGRDMLVHVWQGSLWITQERDTRDIVLEAGQSFRLDRNGVALVKSWDETVLALSSPNEQRPARAIELRAPTLPIWNLRPQARRAETRGRQFGGGGAPPAA